MTSMIIAKAQAGLNTGIKSFQFLRFVAIHRAFRNQESGIKDPLVIFTELQKSQK